MIALSSEQRATFDCFGSECTVIAMGGSGTDDAGAAVARARRRLLQWHHQFSRFEADSELSRLNRDPRPTVEVSPLMGRIVQAAVNAAVASGGLVDPALGQAIEQAGYRTHLDTPPVSLATSLALAPPRAPAAASPARWREISVDRRAGTVTRPPGVALDPGGIAKGVFADELAALLWPFDAFVVDCAGDMRIGGRANLARAVHVADPFSEEPLHTFEIASGAVATSGIGKRSWLTPGGAPAHHLLDPSTGRPAFTGLVQASALAPSATEAEMRSKTAVLLGPGAAARVLEHGGVVVLDDGSTQAY